MFDSFYATMEKEDDDDDDIHFVMPYEDFYGLGLNFKFFILSRVFLENSLFDYLKMFEKLQIL